VKIEFKFESKTREGIVKRWEVMERQAEAERKWAGNGRRKVRK